MTHDERAVTIIALCFLFLWLQRGALLRPLLLLARLLLIAGVLAAVTCAALIL